ncbi:MFS transporter [Nocardia sp. NPDC059691]|uniref:MFS transporter n=1 Tax=Nocardia sp. NPDC059691 TaxID=3346908 RepID=UPI0036829B0E
MSDVIAAAGATFAERPRLRSGTGRWIMAAAVLGSALVSIDTTVVNLVVPRIGADLDADMVDLQWVVSGYTLALASLILVGGALGDRYGRRAVFVWGSVVFALSSAWCGVAPDVATLVAARVVQGVAGALITPGSLALIAASLDPRDQGAAIGMWSGLGGVAGAVGPIVGGWLVELAGWRSVFLINVPLAVAVAVVSMRRVPESRDPYAPRRPDLLGTAVVVTGLVVLTYGFIAGQVEMQAAGAVLVAVFVIVQTRVRNPLVPPALFRSRQFTAVNLVTLPVYAALGCVLFLLLLQLQIVAGYSPLVAGTATIPITAIMLLSSGWIGRWAQRHGARLLMTIGLLLSAAGAMSLAGIGADGSYATAVLPGVLLLGAGMAVFVAPLTESVFASVPTEEAGIASGVNNAIARIAQLLAIAAIPGLVGISRTPLTDGVAFGAGYRAAMWICSALFASGATLAATLMPRPARTTVAAPPAARWPSDLLPFSADAVDTGESRTTPSRGRRLGRGRGPRRQPGGGPSDHDVRRPRPTHSTARPENRSGRRMRNE